MVPRRKWLPLALLVGLVGIGVIFFISRELAETDENTESINASTWNRTPEEWVPEIPGFELSAMDHAGVIGSFYFTPRSQLRDWGCALRFEAESLPPLSPVGVTEDGKRRLQIGHVVNNGINAYIARTAPGPISPVPIGSLSEMIFAMLGRCADANTLAAQAAAFINLNQSFIRVTAMAIDPASINQETRWQGGPGEEEKAFFDALERTSVSPCDPGLWHNVGVEVLAMERWALESSRVPGLAYLYLAYAARLAGDGENLPDVQVLAETERQKLNAESAERFEKALDFRLTHDTCGNEASGKLP